MIKISEEKAQKIQDDYANCKNGVTDISLMSSEGKIFLIVARIGTGITEYEVVEDMTLDDGATVAASEQQIEAHVYLLWELGHSIDYICDQLCMTESELRERPRINELLNTIKSKK